MTDAPAKIRRSASTSCSANSSNRLSGAPASALTGGDELLSCGEVSGDQPNLPRTTVSGASWSRYLRRGGAATGFRRRYRALPRAPRAERQKRFEPPEPGQESRRGG